MKPTMLRSILAGSCFAACSLAGAGTYLENTHTDLAAKKAPAVHKMWFDGGRLRFEDSEHTGILKDQSLYLLNPKDKTYRVLDTASMQRMGDKLSEARKKMDSQLAGMSPEQRAMVEKMMGKAGAGAATAVQKRDVQATGRTETVAGHTCKVWEVAVDGKKEQELCVVAPGALPGGDEMLRSLRQIGELFKGFTKNLGGLGDKSFSAWGELAKVGGIPILSRDFDNGKAASETRLSAVRSEAVPAASFEVPAGYKRKEMTGP